jgi:dihydroorotase
MTLPPRFVIRNVVIWDSTTVFPPQNVWISDGHIEKWESFRDIDEADIPVFEGDGHVLMPSGVDPQVHLRVPGQFHKEKPETGLKAALRGGVGCVLTMPNTQPVIDSPATVELAQKAVRSAETQTGVRVLISAAMTVGQQGEKAVDAIALKKAGVVALTDDGKGVASDSVMHEVLASVADGSLPVLQHAETPGHGAALATGPIQQKLGLKPYPVEAETDMVARDLKLLESFPNARYHVLHVSAGKTVELLRQAQKRGLKATGEVSPHHLLFSSTDIRDQDTAFKMNPPLRDPSDRQTLREALKDGTLSFMATDHAPHEPQAKGTDFRSSSFGTTGLEALLRVGLKLVNEQILTPSRLVEVFSRAPARFLGVDDEFGSLSPGMPLRAILVDVRRPDHPVTLQDCESLSKNSCFLGSPLPGQILAHFNDAGVFRF